MYNVCEACSSQNNRRHSPCGGSSARLLRFCGGSWKWETLMQNDGYETLRRFYYQPRSEHRGEKILFISFLYQRKNSAEREKRVGNWIIKIRHEASLFRIFLFCTNEEEVIKAILCISRFSQSRNSPFKMCEWQPGKEREETFLVLVNEMNKAFLVVFVSTSGISSMEIFRHLSDLRAFSRVLQCLTRLLCTNHENFRKAFNFRLHSGFLE